MSDLLVAVAFVVVIILYLLLIRYLAEYADSKGYSYWLFIFFGLLAPVIAIIVALLLPDNSQGHTPRHQR